MGTPYIPSQEIIPPKIQSLIKKQLNCNKENESIKNMLLNQIGNQKIKNESNLLYKSNNQKIHNIKTLNGFYSNSNQGNRENTLKKRLLKNNIEIKKNLVIPEFLDTNNKIQRPKSQFIFFYESDRYKLQDRKKSQIKKNINDNKLKFNKYLSQLDKFDKKHQNYINFKQASQTSTLDLIRKKRNSFQQQTDKNILKKINVPQILHASLNFTPIINFQNFNEKSKDKIIKSMLKIKNRLLKNKKQRINLDNPMQNALGELELQVNQMRLHDKQNIEKISFQKPKLINKQCFKLKNRKFSNKATDQQISPWLSCNIQQLFDF